MSNLFIIRVLFISYSALIRHLFGTKMVIVVFITILYRIYSEFYIIFVRSKYDRRLMARVKDELLNISGSVGNLVFYQRNGVNYVRTKPSSHRDAKTDKQLVARARFAACNRFYDLIKTDIFRQVWKTAANGTGKNAKNLFVQHSIYAFGKDKVITDYGRLHFSAGLLPLPDGLDLMRNNNRDCLLKWDYNPEDAIGSRNDRLYIVELQADLNVQIHETGICRSESKAPFSTFYDISESTRLYCFWGNEQATLFSESYYFKDIRGATP